MAHKARPSWKLCGGPVPIRSVGPSARVAIEPWRRSTMETTPLSVAPFPSSAVALPPPGTQPAVPQTYLVSMPVMGMSVRSPMASLHHRSSFWRAKPSDTDDGVSGRAAMRARGGGGEGGARGRYRAHARVSGPGVAGRAAASGRCAEPSPRLSVARIWKRLMSWKMMPMMTRLLPACRARRRPRPPPPAPPSM